MLAKTTRMMTGRKTLMIFDSDFRAHGIEIGGTYDLAIGNERIAMLVQSIEKIEWVSDRQAWDVKILYIASPHDHAILVANEVEV